MITHSLVHYDYLSIGYLKSLSSFPPRATRDLYISLLNYDKELEMKSAPAARDHLRGRD